MLLSLGYRRRTQQGGGECIVEIGCGGGQALHGILAKGVASVTGVNHSAVMIEQAACRNESALAQGVYG